MLQNQGQGAVVGHHEGVLSLPDDGVHALPHPLRHVLRGLAAGGRGMEPVGHEVVEESAVFFLRRVPVQVLEFAHVLLTQAGARLDGNVPLPETQPGRLHGPGKVAGAAAGEGGGLQLFPRRPGVRPTHVGQGMVGPAVEQLLHIAHGLAVAHQI